MARHRGKRAYTSRREKLDKSYRHMRTAFFFALIIIVVYVLVHRVELWDYIRTSFY